MAYRAVHHTHPRDGVVKVQHTKQPAFISVVVKETTYIVSSSLCGGQQDYTHPPPSTLALFYIRLKALSRVKHPQNIDIIRYK